MSTEHETHAARPTDLVALVTFDDEVRQNQAVTLDRLADPKQSTSPFNVALAQWLHLGRRMWVSVAGREVRGIATARDLSAKSAWVIDTLIDAADDDAGDEVMTDLLNQAIEAAVRARVTHLLLRTLVDAPGRGPAMRAGFRPALVERWWSGVAAEAAEGRSDECVQLRPIASTDEPGLFRLYSRAIPAETRALLGMTREEWSAVRDRRWLRGGTEIVAERDGMLTGLASFHEQDGQVLIELLAESGDTDSVEALLNEAMRQSGVRELRSLVPRCAGAVERVLSETGLEPADEYVQLCRRIARPVPAEAPVRAGMPVPTGGGA